MYEQLGIVTNIWAKRMESGDSFEDLASKFGENGFREMEVRDHNYLRNSEFGDMMRKIEAAMYAYTDERWKTICEALWRGASWSKLIKAEHKSLFDQVCEFVGKMSGLTLSYAASHVWLAEPHDLGGDNARIIEAKKFAYLLCPHGARFRIVDVEAHGNVDTEVAVANVERYKSLLPSYPMVFAVEHGRQSATWTLELARHGGCPLIYDQANTFRSDGTASNRPEDFWSTVRKEDLASVHIKQRTADGFSTRITDGFVDFKSISNHLTRLGYQGDLLIENTATDQPLEDALVSRKYLLECESDV
jgi:sugar phosphate isomerase/epimerase